MLPLPQTVLGIRGDKDDFAFALVELVDAVVEGQDFGRADEGEGCWDEEEEHPTFAFDIGI